jgi:hypothetical protein
MGKKIMRPENEPGLYSIPLSYLRECFHATTPQQAHLFLDRR